MGMDKGKRAILEWAERVTQPKAQRHKDVVNTWVQ